MAVLKKSLSAEKAHVIHLECECAAEAEKRQQLLAERQVTSQLASCQLAEDEGSFQKLKSKVVVVAAMMSEWRDLTTEAAAELTVGQADVALQPAFQTSTREG